jgi:hypothetical protein
MARFSGIPDIPQAGIDEWQALVLSSLKENVELLTGQRGEPDGASQALVRGQIALGDLPTQRLTRVTAQGFSVTTGNVAVPTFQDYANLLRDFNNLAADYAALRSAVETIIRQLRG